MNMADSEPTIPTTDSTSPVAADKTVSSPVASTLATPPELEQTLSMLSAHRTVLGYLVLSRTHPVRIIKHSGVVFEGEHGRKYAGAVGKIVEAVQGGLEDVGAGNADVDEVRFIRIRTKRHELLISPDKGYLLLVLQDPTS